MLDAKSLYDFKKQRKRKNNGRKIRQELPLWFRKSLSCKLLEVERLFQRRISLIFLVSSSPLSICPQPAQQTKSGTGTALALTHFSARFTQSRI